MSVDNPTSKIVVFDTKNYAGNFEREMCAFITGQVGECGVGEEEAETAREQAKFLDWYADNVVSEADEHGCERPASIWPTPARFNDGVGNHYDDTPQVRATLQGSRAKARHPAYESVAVFVEELPPEDVLDEMISRAKQYCAQSNLTYLGCRLLEPQYEVKQVRVVAAHQQVRVVADKEQQP